MRAAVYARMSTDKQSAGSQADHVRERRRSSSTSAVWRFGMLPSKNGEPTT